MTITVELGVLMTFSGILVGFGIAWGLMRGEMTTLNRLIQQWRKDDDALHHDHETRLRVLEKAIGT